MSTRKPDRLVRWHGALHLPKMQQASQAVIAEMKQFVIDDIELMKAGLMETSDIDVITYLTMPGISSHYTTAYKHKLTTLSLDQIKDSLRKFNLETTDEVGMNHEEWARGRAIAKAKEYGADVVRSGETGEVHLVLTGEFVCVLK